jgi:DNA primase
VRYQPALLEDIRARLPVSAVVGRKVQLKKAGREWKGLSPFNAEKTPSFFVNDQKGFYHCFSSGKHGDIFSFLMETGGLSFPEAVEELAAEAGVALPRPSSEAERQEEKRKTLSDVVDAACRFFEGQLQTGKGQAAREYLKNRGIGVETQAEFRIGYAPDSRNALLDHLRSQGIGDDQIVAAGLAIEPDDGRGLYDRFRGRVIIPIEDATGRVVAFGGRALSPEAQPKYLNSPETELFKKGEVVFNWHRARRAAHQTGSAIVVEGYLDAIAVFQAGMRSVVATLGTAFTERQIKELWRLAPEPVICFDGDNAGRAAAYRALDRILADLETGWSFRFGFLPAGQDPDDLIRSEGKEAFRHVIDEALPMWDVLWAREVDAANLATPDGQAVLEKRLGDLIGTIKDDRLRRLYALRSKISLSDLFWRHGREMFAKARPKTSVALPRASLPLVTGPPRQNWLEQVFLGMCVEFPDWALDAYERLAALTLRGSSKDPEGETFEHQQFANELINLITTETVATAREVYRRLDPIFSGALDFLHGRESPDKAMGHRLRERFPILKLNPAPDFLERCFWHFLERLELREREGELKGLLDRPPREFDEDLLQEAEHIQGGVMTLQKRIRTEENELAEEAQAFRSPSGGRPAMVRLAA